MRNISRDWLWANLLEMQWTNFCPLGGRALSSTLASAPGCCVTLGVSSDLSEFSLSYYKVNRSSMYVFKPLCMHLQWSFLEGYMKIYLSVCSGEWEWRDTMKERILCFCFPFCPSVKFKFLLLLWFYFKKKPKIECHVKENKTSTKCLI